MGQTFSNVQTSPKLANDDNTKTKHARLLELPNLFNSNVRKLYSPIELLCLKKNLGLPELTSNTNISKVKLLEAIGIPSDSMIGEIVFTIIRQLSYFFSLNCSGFSETDSISVFGILKAASILNPEKSLKLFGNRRLKIEIVILCFSTDRFDILQDSHTGIVDSTTSDVIEIPVIGNSVMWSEFQQLLHSVECHINSTNVSASKLLSIIQLCLLLSTIVLGQNKTLPLSKLYNLKDGKLWGLFHDTALCILRSCDLSLSANNYNEKDICGRQFVDLICNPEKPQAVTFPYLLEPFCHVLDSLFYDKLNGVEPLFGAQSLSRILDRPRLAQLATVLPADNVYFGLQKMYIASNDGFSISALENRIFKWMAPTVMLIKGKTSHESQKLRTGHYDASRSSGMTSAFERDFPKFYPTDDLSLPKNDDFEREHEVLFAVYTKEPWKISNKECFGDNSSYILQMAQRQIVCRSSGVKDNFAYFSNVGGGVGFGSQPPLVKNSVAFYRPGEVSLTLDSGLEYGNFRHLSVPGTFERGSCYLLRENTPEYEVFFHVTNIEVWGCGSESELEEQKKRWDWENREAASRKQLNSVTWDDGRALLEMAGLVGKNQYGGSM
ncbi:RTC5 [Brettanomyces bruxellensis]|uniref:DEBR0S5_02102g1_1 n=1 Tax=Dekkera bruxellensis TaxID=5007 RepID=A0A7D9CZL5_DEKBR|nr:RTC5 [Brettanomyces bruxellensis]